MSQHDLDIANQGFPATRADINNALQALGSSNSGATAPSTTYANQLWYDTANNIIKIRNEDNDAWISLFTLDQTADAVTQIDIDNIRIDGNTISSTDTNGDITLDPNGTAGVTIASGHDLTVDTDALFVDASANSVGIGTDTPTTFGDSNTKLAVVTETSNANDINIRFGTNDVKGIIFVNDVSGDSVGFGTTTNDHVQFNTNNTERMRIDSSGHVGVSNTAPGSYQDGAREFVVGTSGDTGITVASGSSSNGSIFFADGTNGGQKYEGQIRYEHSVNRMFFATGGTGHVYIDVNGNLGVGQATMSGSNRLYSTGSYAATTGQGANLFIGDNGLLERSTSSQRYKNTINDATHGLTELMALRPVTYKHNSNGDMIFGGLIAEEVHTAGLTEFVVYSEDDNGDDQPEALHYGNMVSLCIKAIQELKTYLDAEKAKTSTLQTQVADLTTRVAALEA